MEFGYACFILALYVLLVLIGIAVYEHWEKKKLCQRPMQLPVLTRQEKSRDRKSVV